MWLEGYEYIKERVNRWFDAVVCQKVFTSINALVSVLSMYVLAANYMKIGTVNQQLRMLACVMLMGMLATELLANRIGSVGKKKVGYGDKIRKEKMVAETRHVVKLKKLINRLLDYKKKCDEMPLFFSMAAMFKLQIIVQYFCMTQFLAGWSVSILIGVVSLYTWFLREFEYKNSRLEATCYQDGKGFLLASSCLHFMLNSISSFGFLASLYLQGGSLFLVMIFAGGVLLHTGYEGYKGCYYSGSESVPWYFKPFLRQDVSQIAKVEKQMAAKRVISRLVRRWKARREDKRQNSVLAGRKDGIGSLGSNR